MKFFKINLFLCLILFFFTKNVSGQTYIAGYATIVNQCSQTNITTNLTQYEALGVKRRGTVALQNTLDWLKNKYLSYGYTVSQFQEDSFTNGAFTCKNLIVTKIGTVYPNIFVIVDGHYDSITGKGTNDNGSGVVTILEIARLLQNLPTEYSIKFINFSGEEDGLIGSQHYVNTIVNATNPKLNIKVVFNIDEVGGVAGQLNDTITCERDTGNPTSNNAASNVITNQLINCVQLYSPLNTLLASAYASDYMTFENNNEVITGFFETNESTVRHTASDLLVNMDPIYNFNVAKAAIGATLHFAVANTNQLENENFNKDFQVSFYPNPTQDLITVNTGILNATNYTFSLIDVFGKTVFNTKFTTASLEKQFSIAQFPSGVYLAVLETDQNRITKKIVKK